MTAFVVLGALLVAVALLFVVPPLLRRGSGPGTTRDAVNVAVYRDQLRELDADLRAGTLARDQHERARASAMLARIVCVISDSPGTASRIRSQ